jgi:hypothetical protein
MAHCVHIDGWEMALLAETQTFVSHQPRSNMNNAVGAAELDADAAQRDGCRLGNDGFSNDMFAEMKVADLLQKAAHSDPRYLGADQVVKMAIHHNRQLAATLFDRPVGIVAPGAYADLILLDHYPTTPLHPGNLPWHLLFGFNGGQVHSAIVQGVPLMSPTAKPAHLRRQAVPHAAAKQPRQPGNAFFVCKHTTYGNRPDDVDRPIEALTAQLAAYHRQIDELRAANQALEQAAQHRNALLADLGHDCAHRCLPCCRSSPCCKNRTPPPSTRSTANICVWSKPADAICWRCSTTCCHSASSNPASFHFQFEEIDPAQLCATVLDVLRPKQPNMG